MNDMTILNQRHADTVIIYLNRQHREIGQKFTPLCHQAAGFVVP